MENFPAVEMKEIENSKKAILNLLKSQKALFLDQINEFHRIVSRQFELTGNDHVSSDLIAGLLNHKRGKRSKASLNPKAVEYLHTVFSVKDTTSKKETHEISTQCGTTVSQVREFFKTERSKVKKLVQRSKTLSGSKKRNSSKRLSKSLPDASNVNGGISNVSVDLGEKEFIDKILNMMSKEVTFSGQVKLMEWILQIQNKAALSWLSTKGGIAILSKWLNDATLEEQTTVISTIFKVFRHIPLDKARRTQVSDILQMVNKLRFYRNPEISKSAKDLLSSWSSMLMRRRRLENDRKHLIKISALTQNADDRRGPEPEKGQKQLLSSSDTSEKHELSMPAERTEESGNVHVLVEHPDSKLGRNRPVAKESSSNQSRPPSANDMNKAKMLAVYTQEKDGNTSEKHELSMPAERTEESGKFQVLVEHPDSNLGRNRPVAKESSSDQSRPLSANDMNKAKMLAVYTQEKDGNTPPDVKKPPLNNQIIPIINAGQAQTVQESSDQTGHQILPNPKEPEASEINYNDVFTTVIPTEEHTDDTPANVKVPATIDFTEVDLDLLQVLLNNPELVKALTRASQNLTLRELCALLESVKKAGGTQLVPVSRPISFSRPNWPIRNNQTQLASPPKALTYDSHITQNLDYALQHQQPLPMQLVHNPNHGSLMPSSYYQANNPLTITQHNLSLSRPVSLPWSNLPVYNNQANLACHLTVPGYFRPEFMMYDRGRGYYQSKLNLGHQVREKRLPGPRYR